jgi:hypothetical protein
MEHKYGIKLKLIGSNSLSEKIAGQSNEERKEPNHSSQKKRILNT